MTLLKSQPSANCVPCLVPPFCVMVKVDEEILPESSL